MTPIKSKTRNLFMTKINLLTLFYIMKVNKNQTFYNNLTQTMRITMKNTTIIKEITMK